MGVIDTKKLKVGDKIVRVRKHYQNYDHTRIPCEPMVYTISWLNGGEMCMEEDTGHPFFHSKDNVIYGGSASGWDNRQIFEDFVTFNDYVSGNFVSGIILDKTKYKNLEEFLEVKRKIDYERAKEEYTKKLNDLKEKHGKL
jgi:hypothetical protein